MINNTIVIPIYMLEQIIERTQIHFMLLQLCFQYQIQKLTIEYLLLLILFLCLIQYQCIR